MSARRARVIDAARAVQASAGQVTYWHELVTGRELTAELEADMRAELERAVAELEANVSKLRAAVEDSMKR